MRFDRFITLKLVQPCHRTFGTRPLSQALSLPILMYHSISDDSEAGILPYYRVCASPARFREQMQWLKNEGWQGVSLSTGLASLNPNSKIEVSTKPNSRSAPEPGSTPVSAMNFGRTPAKRQRSHDRNEMGGNSELRPVVLTFDDGYRDFYTAAWPILHEFGFAATMFLPTAFIGDTPRSFNSRPCLIWYEVRELHRAGVEFGSHTVTHPTLTEVGWPKIRSEVRDSKTEIEKQLGVPCKTFAYPFAFPETNRPFVRQFRDVLAETGYHCCATTKIGQARPADDLMQLKRLPVNSGDDPAFFRAKLAGAYDWVAPVQFGMKRIKSVLLPRRNPDPNGTASRQVLAAK